MKNGLLDRDKCQPGGFAKAGRATMLVILTTALEAANTKAED
jgi:hypothetical protein